METALISGELAWTKVRLLAPLPSSEDLGSWIGFARTVTAAQLSRSVRAVDGASIEAGALEETPRGRLFAVRCSPEVRRQWAYATKVAARVAEQRLHVAEAAEVIAAEVLSAVPIDDDADQGCSDHGISWEEAAEETENAEATPDEGRLPWRTRTEEAEPPSAELPPALCSLVEGVDDADPFELDVRLRRALSLEQRLEARLGPWLSKVWTRPVYRALGHRTRDDYARERLGMDPTRARALVRLERSIAGRVALERAYRSGALSWVKASTLAPLATEDDPPLLEEWVAWAGKVTVRRLRDDVEEALTLAETDPQAFRRGAGLPAEAHREIGATLRETERDSPTPLGSLEPFLDREIGAMATAPEDEAVERRVWAMAKGRYDQGPTNAAPDETCGVSFVGSPETVQLFSAVLSTVRRRLGAETGRLPTPGQALAAMLDHALESWGALDERVAKRHRVFARDGWRCTAPGCTSLRNLHDHHIRFRSAGGSDNLANRTTLCAFHHLRGIHAGLLHCVGSAPDGLRWEMGIRPGQRPLMAYRSGDVTVAAARAS